ncbi:calcium channel protein [Dissophora globulifera]|nr:calcium channel protein [Dissophora globulifera]
MSGFSEVMANVSSRVVNTRAQEHTSNRLPPLPQSDISDTEQSDKAKSSQRNSFQQDAVTSSDIPPWNATSTNPVGSENGSVRMLRRSESKRSSGSHGQGVNLGVKTSQQGNHGPVQGTDHSRSVTGSFVGKANSAVPEKVFQGDEESTFAPGGFVHRGSDKMRLEGRSLMIFSPDNPLRLWLASVLMSKYTDPFILVVILTQWVFFVITPTTPDIKNTFGTYWTQYGLLAVNILYTLEIMAKAIVTGNSVRRSHSLSRVNSAQSRHSNSEKLHAQTNHPSLVANEAAGTPHLETDTRPAHAPFFRSYYNRLDGIVVVSYWIDFVLMLTGVQSRYEIYIFKAISALRPLRLLSLTEGTSTIIDSLSMSAPLLLTILVFIFFFFMILSLIGLLIFQGALSRRCAIQQPDDPTTWIPAQPEVICGGYYSNGTIMGIVNYFGQGDGDDSSPRISSMICQEGQICLQVPNYNPDYGLVSFDNLLFSLLTVFTISSMEGWTDVQYWAMDGDSRWAAIFFCAVIFSMSFLMIPLFIAGITYSFGAVRAEKRHSAFSNKTRSTRTLLDTAEGWQFEDQIHQARSPFRQWLIRIVNDPWFPTVGAIMVLLDLLAMCFRRYDSSPTELMRIDNVEVAFTFYFLAEIGIRIAGHSTWQQFWKRKSNKFDLFLAIVTTILLIPVIHNWEWFRYLTAFQVMRAYRLIPAIPGVRDLMGAVIGSATGMFNLLLITFMFLLVCAPVPMMLFGGDMATDDPQPINFDDLGQSFISLFIILTGENWVNIMYNALDSHPERYKQVYGVVFFVIYYCASHYVLLNLFIAIVLEHFDMDDDEKYKKQLEIYFETHQRSKLDKTTSAFHYLNPYAYLPARPQTLTVRGLPVDQTVTLRKNVFRQFLEGDNASNTTEITESKPRFIVWLEDVRDYWFPTQAQLEAMESAKPLLKGENPDMNMLSGGVSGFGMTQDEIDANLERLDAGLEKITWDMDKSNEDPQNATDTLSPEGYRKAKAKETALAEDNNAEIQEFLEAHPMYDRSLFLLPSNNRFRQWCRRLVGPRSGRNLSTMNRFNWFIFLCIILSIAVIIADDPVDRQIAMDTGNTRRQDILGDIDYIITIVFVVEQCLRILADGFLLTPTAYLRDTWNCMDVVIVIMSCVMTFAQIDHLYNISRAIRALSCLRVLRIVRYFEGVSAMFRAITKALPRMVVALVLTAMLFWPFAIYGVNIYAGYFYLCNDSSVLNKSDCVGEFMNSPTDEVGDILTTRVWANPYDYSFDTIQAAVLTLFEMASQEGWVAVLQSGRATPNSLGEQPFIQADEPNRFNSFYFLVFMLIGSIVFVQIFIGVILETFKTWQGISLLTVEQRRWIDLRRQLRLIKPTATPARPHNRIRAFCYDLVIEKRGALWKFMTVILVLNVCLIASQHYGQPQLLTDIQDISYFIFLGLYSIEIMIKLSGYGFHKWRLSRWNLYDMAITALAIITLVPRFIGHELWTLRLEKFLLITISFRLAQRIDSLQVLFRALVIAMESILNITAVFMVVFTVYAVMFRELFGTTRLGPSTTGIANFDSFGNTMLMLIRMTTGENWDFVMHDMMVEAPNCTPSRISYLDGDCGSRPWAYFMFLSFYIICTYILLNMFIAVIISNFSFAYQQDSLTTLITREDLRNYKLKWAVFDPRGTGYIDPKYLSKFLTSLEGRLCTRIYAKPEYSIPYLVKTYTLAPEAVAPRSSSTGDAPNPSTLPSSSVNNGITSHRPILGLGSSRRLSRLPVSPSLSATTSQGGGSTFKAVPITISSPKSGTGDEKHPKLEARLDMQGLQQALSRIDTQDVYQRRQIFNFVYKEALSACTARGISFYSILDILSFTLVNIEHALGMEEFLKRHEHVKEIKDAVARETIHNLLLTIVARRSFLKQRRAKQNSRLRPEVPRIVIDNSIGNERGFRQDTSPMLTSSPSGRSSFLPSPVLDFSKGHSYQSDDDASPTGRFSTNTMLSIGSNDSNGWESYERDSYNRMSGQSDIYDFMPGSPSPGYAVEGSTWFSMLQDQIQEQDEEALLLPHNDPQMHSSSHEN